MNKTNIKTAYSTLESYNHTPLYGDRDYYGVFSAARRYNHTPMYEGSVSREDYGAFSISAAVRPPYFTPEAMCDCGAKCGAKCDCGKIREAYGAFSISAAVRPSSGINYGNYIPGV